MSDTRRTPFSLALAARKGEIPPEHLPGAARRLFKDKTLSDSALAEYGVAQPVGTLKRNSSRGQIRAKRT